MSEITEFDRLMAEVAAGSEEAVMELAETYTPHILRSVRRCMSPKIRPKLDSQDVAQTLWASLLLRRSELLRLKTREQLIAYLVRASRNKVAEKAVKLRTQKRDIDREEPLGLAGSPIGNRRVSQGNEPCSREPTPSTHASLRERWRKAISTASERDRRIVELVLQRRTYDEIGQILAIHEQTARRAVEKLVQELADRTAD
jgi:RNA polymerase sigma factor (sigma-70 family)